MREVEQQALQQIHIPGEAIATAAAGIRPRPYTSIELDYLGVSLAFSKHFLQPDISHIARADALPTTPTPTADKLLCVRVDEPLDGVSRKRNFFVGIRIGDGPQYFLGRVEKFGRLVLDEKKEPGEELLLDQEEAIAKGLEVTIYQGDIRLWEHNITIRHGIAPLPRRRVVHHPKT